MIDSALVHRTGSTALAPTRFPVCLGREQDGLRTHQMSLAETACFGHTKILGFKRSMKSSWQAIKGSVNKPITVINRKLNIFLMKTLYQIVPVMAKQEG